jgi:hypothetical protein
MPRSPRGFRHASRRRDGWAGGKRRHEWAGRKYLHLLFEKPNPCYLCPVDESDIRCVGRFAFSLSEESIFIWIRCNPLKNNDSAKGIQGNPSYFAWFYLVLLGFIWPT